ncbi:MAG: DUF1460 domain-containing protein [Tatlockia sp.]|nr:DUF1460 domain-containing protein [Tatlockia sp.]
MWLVYIRKPLMWIAFPSFLFLLSPLYASDPNIQTIYEDLNKSHPTTTMANRLDFISAKFLGKPYSLGALGEGPDAHFDQKPRYRLDAFDCDTFVTTVLALALAIDDQSFEQCISKIRYKEGKVDFLTRNHFISADWNPNNQNQKFIKDITKSIKDQKDRPVAQIAVALIDKPSWYQHFSLNIIRLNSADKNEQMKKLDELKLAGSKLEKIEAEIPYVPLTALFNAKGKPDDFLFRQIPHGAIIEIVRPNWNLKNSIGTNLNVSHLGFAFWKEGILLFRQASSQLGKVVEVPLIDYLKDSLKSPTIKGINIEVVVPKAPSNELCSTSD